MSAAATDVTRARQAAGLTQRELADRLALTLDQLDRIEQGRDRAEFSDEELVMAVASASGQGIPTIVPAPSEPSTTATPAPRLSPARSRLSRLIRSVRRDTAEVPDHARTDVSPSLGPDALRPVERPVHDRTRRIRQARRDEGLDQAEFARRVGIPMWTLELLERGDEDVRPWLGALERANPTLVGGWEPDELAGGRSPQLSPSGAPVGDHRSYDIKLVCGMLTVLVVVRFFTEVVHILPRAAQFIDIPLFVLIAAVAGTRRRPSSRVGEAGTFLLVPGTVILGLCVLAAMVNPGRVEIAPVLVFIYGLLSPLVLFGAIYRLWPPGHAREFSTFVVSLGVMELLVVAFVDVPQFISSNNPDDISGTFGENAYQLVFFLIVFAALLVGVFTFERQRLAARAAPVLLVGVLATVFLAQYRALLLTLALTVVLIAGLMGVFRSRGLVATALVGLAFFFTLNYVGRAFPILALPSTISDVRSDPKLYVDERVSALSTAAELYADKPLTTLTGAGPGTFSSRAWQTFAQAGAKSDSNVAGGYALSLVGGRPYHTDVSDRYVLPRIRNATVINGSTATSSPFSSYISTAAEIGLLGAFLLAFIYVRAFFIAARMTIVGVRRGVARDPLPALLLASTAALFVLIQMGLLNNWLEVTRVTFIAWGLFAVTVKEYRARLGLLGR